MWQVRVSDLPCCSLGLVIAVDAGPVPGIVIVDGPVPDLHTTLGRVEVVAAGEITPGHHGDGPGVHADGLGVLHADAHVLLCGGVLALHRGVDPAHHHHEGVLGLHHEDVLAPLPESVPAPLPGGGRGAGGGVVGHVALLLATLAGPAPGLCLPHPERIGKERGGRAGRRRRNVAAPSQNHQVQRGQSQLLIFMSCLVLALVFIPSPNIIIALFNSHHYNLTSYTCCTFNKVLLWCIGVLAKRKAVVAVLPHDQMMMSVQAVADPPKRRSISIATRTAHPPPLASLLLPHPPQCLEPLAATMTGTRQGLLVRQGR